MAIALAQSTSTGYTSADSTTTGSLTTTASGSSFVIAAYWQGGSTPPTISDSKSNTYTLIGSVRQADNNGSFLSHIGLWYVENGTGGSSHTFTAAKTGGFTSVFGGEITGGRLSGLLDQHTGAALDTTSPVTSGSITTTQAAELLIGFVGTYHTGGGPTYTANNSFTIAQQITDATNYWTACLVSRVVTSTGTYETDVSVTNLTSSAALIASFEEDYSGPTLGVHTLLGVEDGSGSDPETTSPINTQASGSSLVTFTAGYSNNTGGPSDSEGNTWTAAGTEVYTGYGGQFDVRGYYVEVATGDTGHTVTFQADGTPAGEMTIPFVEIKNAGELIDYAQNYPAAGNPLTSGDVTTTGPAVLVAFWWGDATGLTHTAVPNNNFTTIESFVNLPPNSAVQCVVAVREVMTAGTYNVTWTETPDQGAPLWLFAFQQANGTATGLSVRRRVGVGAGAWLQNGAGRMIGLA